MTKPFILLLSCLLQFNVSTKAQDIYFPPLIGNNWEALSPSSLNWCDENIEAFYDFLEVEQTKSFILLKNGKIVLEQYFGCSKLTQSNMEKDHEFGVYANKH